VGRPVMRLQPEKKEKRMMMTAAAGASAPRWNGRRLASLERLELSTRLPCGEYAILGAMFDQVKAKVAHFRALRGPGA
jgi:hypothetical protein